MTGSIFNEGLIPIATQVKNSILRLAPEPGDFPTAISGFMLHRRDAPNEVKHSFNKPTFAVMIQGSKRTVLGTEVLEYTTMDCLLCGIDMPSAYQVTKASPEEPYLGLSLELDTQLLTHFASGISRSPQPSPVRYKGMSVTRATEDILETFGRLVALLKKPEHLATVAPMTLEELHYRLLMGPQGEQLRTVNTEGSQANQVAQAIVWLKEHFIESLSVDELAQKVDMGTSNFHRYFRRVTTLSPLQYQKQLRLYEAQRLMLVENMDATCSCLAVGYSSPTQFSREYKRLFGESPHKNIARLRKVTDGVAARS